MNGNPNEKWLQNKGNQGIIPKPSQLDELDINAPNLKQVGVV